MATLIHGNIHAVDNHADAAAAQFMFRPGDEVETKSRLNPFWMTITSVNERTGFCQCEFGFSGRYAGNFHISELKFYGGNEIEGQLAC